MSFFPPTKARCHTSLNILNITHLLFPPSRWYLPCSFINKILPHPFPTIRTTKSKFCRLRFRWNCFTYFHRLQFALCVIPIILKYFDPVDMISPCLPDFLLLFSEWVPPSYLCCVKWQKKTNWGEWQRWLAVVGLSQRATTKKHGSHYTGSSLIPKAKVRGFVSILVTKRCPVSAVKLYS